MSEKTANQPETKVLLQTTMGDITIALRSDMPITTGNFKNLTKHGIYDNTTFHRVITDFMIQGGDPKGDGSGGPGYSIQDEKSTQRQIRGTLGMAKSGPNTAGSQFYVNLKDNLRLDDVGFTAFAKVVKGMEVVDKIGKLKNTGPPENKALERVVMTKAYVKKGK